MPGVGQRGERAAAGGNEGQEQHALHHHPHPFWGCTMRLPGALIFPKRTKGPPAKPKYEQATPMADFPRPVAPTLSQPTLDTCDAERDEARK
jgi:hypothetical protein